ncbi:NAD+ synthase [Candidatus Woesearchaeota archaeon]|nr:NAD+ synthase [Candidatus Woesearchaeota archaeon]
MKKELEKMERKIINFIRAQAKAASGIVIGLSGGIDSSVVASLCARAIGNRKVVALVMPEHEVTMLRDIQDAKQLASELNIRCYISPIDDILSAIIKSQPHIKDDKKALGNAKARARMILLYAYANMHNYLVAGTGNKSELMTGYFTKYGDGGVDFMPIADVYKTEIIRLARHLNISKSIIDKAPSAGLWRGQTDEEELGMSYEELDSALRGEKASPEKMDRIKELMDNSSHKRMLPKMCRIH